MKVVMLVFAVLICSAFFLFHQKKSLDGERLVHFVATAANREIVYQQAGRNPLKGQGLCNQISRQQVFGTYDPCTWDVEITAFDASLSCVPATTFIRKRGFIFPYLEVILITQGSDEKLGEALKYYPQRLRTENYSFQKLKKSSISFLTSHRANHISTNRCEGFSVHKFHL